MKFKDYFLVIFGSSIFGLLSFFFLEPICESGSQPSPNYSQPYVPAEIIFKLTPEAGSRIISGLDSNWAMYGSSEFKIIAQENHFLPPEPVFRTLRAASLSPTGLPIFTTAWVAAILRNYPQRRAPKHATIPNIEHLYLIRIGGEGKTIPEICRELEKLPEVIYAEPNYILEADVIPNDPDYCLMWALNNTGQSGGTPNADIDASEAWDTQKGSWNTVIGVIDTGVDYFHPDLFGNLWVNEGEVGEDAEGKRKSSNGVDDDGNGYVDDFLGWDFRNHDNDPMDDYYHGTAVSGIIAAVGNEGNGIPGINWTARIMALKFLGSKGSGSTVDAIRAVEYATLMGADILNNSYGGGGYSRSFKEAIQTAYAAGVSFVASAGNDGNNNDTDPRYPSSYNVPNVVAVAATDFDDNRAIWSSTKSSNWGPTSVDLAGPGKGNYTTSPGNSYRYFSGTSSASPHVAGVAGLIRAQNPNLSVDETKNILLTNVDQIHDFEPEGSTPILTGGRVNARKCVESVAAGQSLGRVKGKIKDSSTGSDIAGARISIIETGQITRSDINGLYSITSTSGDCILSSLAYGFAPQTAAIFVPGGGSINHDFEFSVASTGILSGVVRDSKTGESLKATLKIYWEGDCVEEVNTTLPSGEYTTDLFEGKYAISVLPDSDQYCDCLDFGIEICGGETTTLNFDLIKIGFRNVTTSMGLGLPAYYNIKGITWLDYNNDGWLDLYLGDDHSTTYSNLLFRNNSGLDFADVTSSTGVGDIGRTVEVVAADFDNDGDDDIFVANWGQFCWEGAENRLFVNNGGTFSEEASGRGLIDFGSTNSAAFGDYNQDGILDLVIGNSGQMDFLYRGWPSGSFTSANQEANFEDYGDASGISFADYDCDGDPDLFIGHANYCSYGTYHLLRNDYGGFTDITLDSGIYIPGDGFSHGSAWGDYDNDLDLDLYICSIRRNFLFRNDGGIFTDVTASSGVASGEQQYNVAWGDYDNDGDLDLVIPRWPCSGASNCLIFENQGDGTFRDVTSKVGLGDIRGGRDAAWADFDRDGDLDLYIGQTLWENLSGNENNWLRVRLQGNRSNRDGIGAKVFVTIDGSTQLREITANGGSQRIAHFGLGQATKVDRVEIYWPSNSVSYLDSVPANQTLEIQEDFYPYHLFINSGDYDGDGEADIAIFREDIGLWAVRGLGRVYFGGYGDIPVSGDYNGDGYTDIAVFRPSTGLWAIKNLSRLYYGNPCDIPAPADYNGDGSCDIATFDSGIWNLRAITTIRFGASGDIPIAEDYDGDGSDEIAVFRPSTGLWAVSGYTRCYFGRKGDIPVPGIFRWYGASLTNGVINEQVSMSNYKCIESAINIKAKPFKSQIAIFRPSNGLWAIRGYSRFYFGNKGDMLINADFDGNSLNEIGIFRPTSGLWALRGISRIYFGTTSDIPLTK